MTITVHLDPDLPYIDMPSDSKLQASFEVLVRLLNHHPFDLQKTLAHLETMKQSTDALELTAYLNQVEIPSSVLKNPLLKNELLESLRLIPFLAIHYEAYYSKGSHREIFTATEPSFTGFNQEDLFVLLEAVLDLGVDINQKANDSECALSALYVAVNCRDQALLSFLLERGADPNTDTLGMTPLYSLAPYRDLFLEMAELLLQHGANPNIHTSQCTESPLHVACQVHHFKMLELLHRFGGDLNLSKQSHLKMSPLIAAAAFHPSQKHQPANAFLTWMIDRGADVHAMDANGKTAFHWAAYKGRTDLAHCLLEHGAKLNQPAAEGNTELHILAKHTSQCRDLMGMLDFLVSRGSDFTLLNHHGKTPYDLAIECRKFEVADFFKACMEQKILQQSLDFQRSCDEKDTIISDPLIHPTHYDSTSLNSSHATLKGRKIL